MVAAISRFFEILLSGVICRFVAEREFYHVVRLHGIEAKFIQTTLKVSSDPTDECSVRIIAIYLR